MIARFMVSMACGWLIGGTGGALAVTHEVGQGKEYPSIGAVPWESLQAGDTVLIHWRAEPYREKWVICREGTAAAPITVRGVPGPTGQRPVIDGEGATTRLALDYWNENRNVIKIGGASIPANTTPKFIVIENLDIRGARPPFTFTDDGGAVQPYVANAAAIQIERGEHITIRNCILRDCGNGLFVSSSTTEATREVLVEGNYIHDNGNSGSIYEHNNYTAALGITFQFNRFGPLRAGCSGNNLKDRSAGLVVRYNWLEGGNRQLDLVDAEDSPLIRDDPRYRTTHVYGNVLVEPDGAGNRQIVHYGGDSGTTADYRKGILHFYQNTVVSTRTDRTALFRLSTNDERCDARNNIFYVSAAGNTLSLMDAGGVLDLRRNWFKPGRVVSFGSFTGTVNDDGTSLAGATPGFVDEAAQDFRLAANSSCVNAATALHPDVMTAHDLTQQYQPHQAGNARPAAGPRDLGALEYSRLQSWRSLHFDDGANGLASDDADPDGDGLANLLEYALALDPWRASAGMPAAVTGNGQAAIRFHRLAPPAEVTYLVETSVGLDDWQGGSQYADTGDTPHTGSTTEVARTGLDPLEITVATTTPVGETPRQFLRLRVTRP